jgi:hypothetical protein
MLEEDMICTVILIDHGLSGILKDIIKTFKDQLDHPIWSLFKTYFTRSMLF